MLKNLAKLIDVKSIVTLTLTILFFILAIRGTIDSQSIMTVYTTVIAFYFGTQVQKKKEAEEDADKQVLDKGKLQYIEEPRD